VGSAHQREIDVCHGHLLLAAREIAGRTSMNQKNFLRLAAILIFINAAARAETTIPRLYNVFPCGAKAGTSLDLEISASTLEDPIKLYFSHPGIKGELIPEDQPAKPEDKDKDKDKEKDKKKKNDGKARRFKISVDAKVPVGDYDVRVVAKAGISNPRTFVVSDFDEAQEKEPNNSKAEATRVNLNSTVNGRIGGSEDVDWLVFSAKSGQRVLIECQAWRIDSRLDGFMWLYNAEGKQLAMSQDEDLRDEKRDPFIDFDVPADGDYFLKLTDFTYNGSNDYFYRVSITHNVPYIDFISPTGAAPGTNAPVTFYGRNLPGGEKTDFAINGRPLQKGSKPITVPSDPEALTNLDYHELVRPWASLLDGMEVRLKGDGGSSNTKLLLYDALPQVAEVEPNNDPKKAQRVTIPCAINGNFDREDSDCFVFAAKKDEKISVVVHSNRIGAPADPDMEILKADGSVLASPQDWGENIGQIRFTSNSRDIYHMQNIPADGDYTIRLEHLFRQAQGGPHYRYRLELQRDPMPDFRIICQAPDEIKLDSHLLRQGGRERVDVLVWRMYGMDDPITVEARNLPKGVTADPIVIGKGVKWGTLVLTAAPDAEIGENEIQFVGTAEVRKQKLVRKARGGTIVWDTVNTPALARLARSSMLAVREKVAFAVTAEPKEITLKQGDPLELTVKVARREDMPNAVQINGAGYALPPNMSIPTKSIDPGQTEVKVTIDTNKLPEGTFSFIVQGDGQVPINKDKSRNLRCVYPSNPVKITVEAKEPKEKKK
jgi:hypothetical protein